MPKKELKDRILYVGLDDSNHAGKRKGEIITAVFSHIYEDSLKTHFPRERKIEEDIQSKNWIGKKRKRDFRFTILTHNISSKNSYNLFLVAPYLIQNYLEKIYPPDLDKIEIYFDGKMMKSWEEMLQEDFKKIIPIGCFNFTGPNKTNVPYVLGVADRISHFLFKGEFGNLDSLLKNPKMVPINCEDTDFIKRKEGFSNSGKFYK